MRRTATIGIVIVAFVLVGTFVVQGEKEPIELGRRDFAWRFTCPQVDRPVANTDLLHIWVTNQSDRADWPIVSILLDGKSVFRGVMPFGAAHTHAMIDLRVPKGRHEIEVSEGRSETKQSYGFEVKGERWITVSFWRTESGPLFRFRFFDSQPGIM